MPSMLSKDRFSSIRTMTCLMSIVTFPRRAGDQSRRRGICPSSWPASAALAGGCETRHDGGERRIWMALRKPHIAIIGAGIGGLTAAACLRRAGIDVCIYEQARGFTRLGAGIQQAPNSIRVLYALGLKDKLLARAFQPESNDSRDHDTGELTNSLPLGASVQERHGVPYFLMHRGDLHAMLADLVPAEIVRLNHKLAGLDQAAYGTVRLTFTNSDTA